MNDWKSNMFPAPRVGQRKNFERQNIYKHSNTTNGSKKEIFRKWASVNLHANGEMEHTKKWWCSRRKKTGVAKAAQTIVRCEWKLTQHSIFDVVFYVTTPFRHCDWLPFLPNAAWILSQAIQHFEESIGRVSNNQLCMHIMYQLIKPMPKTVRGYHLH